MTTYNVLLPVSLLEDGQDSYGIVKTDTIDFAIIDVVQHDQNAEYCRRGLVNHDGYSPYIICMETDYKRKGNIPLGIKYYE